jgi:hypothetical protein
MNTITYHSGYDKFSLEIVHKNLLTRFLAWTKKEEKNHIAWVGISITAMSAVFFPITMSAILFNGAIFKLIIGAIFSLALVVIASLAALPTKYTIPAFLTGIIIDIVLIMASFII